MAAEDKTDAVHIENAVGHSKKPSHHHHHQHVEVKNIQEEAAEVQRPLDLGWRTWLVVFIAAFTIMAQVYTTVAAASVIAFIAMDFPQGAALSGWIIQGPLLMQAALSPIVGRLSDLLDRKYLASIPPLIAFVGAIVCAKAENMNTLIGGGILIGVTLSTIAIVQSIPSEVLPLKYRPLANGISFLGGASAGIIGQLSAGAYSGMGPGGWRNIFWTQAAFHLTSSIGFLAFYWPQRHSDFPRMKISEYVWACDPIGSTLFIGSATLILLSLDWAAGTYPWSDAHVVAPLVIGCVLLVVFCLYEWKGRPDGLAAHVFFQHSPNFALSVFAFAVEGWIFYSAVNAITPQMILRLGWQTSSLLIAVRQLSFSCVTFAASLPITWYSTRFKDLKSPLILCYALFLVLTICYACIRPSWDTAQIGLNVLSAVGQAGPLTLLVAAVQFTAPHAFLSTATGLAFSARAIGGAFGSAVLDAIVNAHVAGNYDAAAGAAAARAGLSAERVEKLLAVLQEGEGASTAAQALAALGEDAVAQSGDAAAVAQAVAAGHGVWARAYRLAWASIIPFVVVSLVCVLFLRGVKELMTEKVEATVERVDEGDGRDEEKAAAA